MRRALLAITAVAVLLMATATAVADPPGPVGTGDPVINLAGGFTYSIISTGCTDSVTSTESGLTFPMPEDFDANIVFSAGDETWLLSNHELTQPRPGDFQGDAGKCAVNEQTPADADSDGTGSVSRIVLAKDGVTVLRRELITTGLHDNCAAAQTPWKTYLTNEEFPFINDPELRSGWVWEIDPATGAEKRLTGMGRFSHEQEAFAADGSWYLTNDRGNFQYLYKFIPDRRSDLTTGRLYGLFFDRATNTGTWVGPLDPFAPEADMIARVGAPNATNSFGKAEGIVASASSATRGGNEVTFTESGFGTDPGRVWRLSDLSQEVVKGEVIVQGDFGRLSRPDNLRYNDAGDLFIMEDHGSAEFALAGGSNEIWVLPRGKTGAENLVRFASMPNRFEPTGPWFSNDNHILYLSVQADPPFQSRVIAIQRTGGNFNQPYDG
ncbi:MAG TPA: alkaline phosphatase PhoX [Gaiellaceae bacterium]|jgi:secreted PhoX family phosphatase|nr:alkaline phosphatase PhoX [Gaiellaceae bacterium]